MIGEPLFTTTAVTAIPVSTAAIVGDDSGSPYAAVRLSAAQYMTTGNLNEGQSGDAGGLDGWTVEFWLRVDNISGATQRLVTGPNAWAASPGRQYTISLLTGGAVRFVFRNDSDVNTTLDSTASLVVNVWHHIVCVYQNPTMGIYINGVARGTSAPGGKARQGLITGSNNFYLGDNSNTIALDMDEVAFYRGGALTAGTVAAHYQAGVDRGWNAELSGSRVVSVLDRVGTDAPVRAGTGARQVMPAYMVGQPPLSEIRYAKAADNVDAIFFTSRSGELVYLDASHRSSSPYNTVQATFDDDGTDLPYQGLELDYSETFLVNKWSITRRGTGAVTQTVTDTTSVSRYYERPQSITDMPVVSDGDASTVATALLAKYKDPFTRVTSLSLLCEDPAVTEAVFRRDIGDRIRVFRTPPGGGSRIDQTLFIQKISVDATPSGPWRVTWAVTPV